MVMPPGDATNVVKKLLAFGALVKGLRRQEPGALWQYHWAARLRDQL